MARLPRLTVPGYPHHVILRGNNRQNIFSASADYLRMLALLWDASRAYEVEVHAYVLMTNHIHLLLTPRAEQGVPKMMQAVGRTYVRYFNNMHQRSGTLWEGRYRSTLIQSERYLLTCMAYIDLNPVRAGMVTSPDQYAWSSYSHYVGRENNKLITPHPNYWALGNTPFAREIAYAEMVKGGLSAGQQTALTEAALSGWVLGDATFIEGLAGQTTRRLAPGKRGRPPAPVVTESS